MRIVDGDDYLRFIDDLLDLKNVSHYKFSNYEFKYTTIYIKWLLILKKGRSEHKLARLCCGICLVLEHKKGGR